MLALVKPKPKIEHAVAHFKANNIDAIGVAPIDIESNKQGLAQLSALLQLSNTELSPFIVTSTEAAIRLVQVIKETKFEGKLACCIGESTALILKSFFKECLFPKIQTSEGWLAEFALRPEFNTPSSLPIIVKGEGGRDIIPQSFTDKKTAFNAIDVYRRTELAVPYLTQKIEWQRISMVVVTSAHLLECLLKAYPELNVRNKTWIVPSDRIKQFALSLGCKEIVSSNGATNAHLLGCVLKLQ